MTEWLNGIVGETVAPYATYTIALVVVLILIALLFRIWRAFNRGGFGKASQQRLGVIEAATVDPKRRLVIVRRDNVEHLVMIGGPNDILIESGIQRQAVTPGMQQVHAHPAQTRREAAPRSPQQPSQPPSVAQNQQPQPAHAAQVTPQMQTARPQAQAIPQQQQRQTAHQVPTMARQTPQTSAVPMATTTHPVSSVANTPKVTATAAIRTDSAKVDDDMNRLLNQIAGDTKR